MTRKVEFERNGWQDYLAAIIGFFITGYVILNFVVMISQEIAKIVVLQPPISDFVLIFVIGIVAEVTLIISHKVAQFIADKIKGRVG